MKFNTPINLRLFQDTLKPLQAGAEGRLPADEKFRPV